MAKLTLSNLTASNAAARALPVIQSPPPVTGSAIGPQSLYSQTITLTAGQKYPVMIRGDFIYIEGIVVDSSNLADRPYITLTTDTENTPLNVFETERAYRYPDPFNYVEFFNQGTYTVYITFFAGFGEARRDYGRRLYNTAGGNGNTTSFVPFAAGQLICNGPIIFPAATSPNTQRAKLTKITCCKSLPITANADFTLFLFTKAFNNTATAAAFQFFPLAGVSRLTPADYVTQIRFPTFITAAAGSPDAVCDVSGLSIDIYSNARDPNGFGAGTIYGALVANAAYSPTSAEIYTITMTLEFD